MKPNECIPILSDAWTIKPTLPVGNHKGIVKKKTFGEKNPNQVDPDRVRKMVI